MSAISNPQVFAHARSSSSHPQMPEDVADLIDWASHSATSGTSISAALSAALWLSESVSCSALRSPNPFAACSYSGTSSAGGFVVSARISSTSAGWNHVVQTSPASTGGAVLAMVTAARTLWGSRAAQASAVVPPPDQPATR